MFPSASNHGDDDNDDFDDYVIDNILCFESSSCFNSPYYLNILVKVLPMYQ